MVVVVVVVKVEDVVVVVVVVELTIFSPSKPAQSLPAAFVEHTCWEHR